MGSNQNQNLPESGKLSKSEPEEKQFYNQELARLNARGFTDQGFINTMRFSELNGEEEFDNTHLFIDWHALLEYGLQQLQEYQEWLQQEKDSDRWSLVPEDQKKRIERWESDIGKFKKEFPADNIENIAVFRNYLSKYNVNIATAIYVYDGQTGILNGRMARGRGHKKELLQLNENAKDHDREQEADNKKNLIDKLLNRGN
jgi:hypothetical protein